MHNIAIFASGHGSNFQRIAEYFRGSDQVRITRVFCNRPDAFALKRAEDFGIPSMVFDRYALYESNTVLDRLKNDKTGLIVLAGFLWFVPDNILNTFSGKIINIHPALLPKYGGKGMYGSAVHEAVIKNAENESGITIHYVNGKYDEGEIIFQAKCTVDPHDNADSLAKKIHRLEFEHYAKIIEQMLITCP